MLQSSGQIKVDHRETRSAEPSCGSVRLFVHHSVTVDADRRLEASAGIGPAGIVEPSHGPFLAGAYLPRGPWRAATGTERRRWLSHTAGDFSASVGLVNLGKDFLKPFEEAGLHDLYTFKEVYALRQTPAARRALAQLEQRITDLVPRMPCAHPEMPMEPIWPRHAGLRGTTVDFRRGAHFTGLHVDSWGAARPDLRGKAGKPRVG